MIYATHIPKRKQKQALRDGYAMEPVVPKFNPWSACPITFDHRDHPTSIRHGGSAALVLDPIINGFHLTRVLMDGDSSLNPPSCSSTWSWDGGSRSFGLSRTDTTPRTKAGACYGSGGPRSAWETTLHSLVSLERVQLSSYLMSTARTLWIGTALW